MTVVDLTGPDLEWRDHAISGSDSPARMVLLHADAERETRTVMVRFPPGWSRDAVGRQPAGEEMVMLSGALSISGHTAGVGEFLLIEPRATRSATSAADDTCAVVFFSGPGGGWVDGPDVDPGAITVSPVTDGLGRPTSARMPGSVSVLAAAGGAVLDADADVLWPESRQWAFVPAGSAVPDVPGRAVVRHWA